MNEIEQKEEWRLLNELFRNISPELLAADALLAAEGSKDATV